MPSPCILIVDDRSDIRISARFVLEDNGYDVIEANSPFQAKTLIKEQAINIVLLDMNYSLDTTSGEEGLQFLAWLQKQELNIAAIAMTAWSNVELAVKAMQLGAGDFIEKPWKNQRLAQVVTQQLSISGLKIQNRKLSQRLEINNAEHENSSFQWQSPCMQALYKQIVNIAPTNVSILLTGDNGTGKSELAKYIHTASEAKNEAFIAVNMGAISESLFESEMFGHKKGAFTDAKSNRIGRFELAQNGTLFLDEIANIPMSQQAKLLRVLESGEYEILGSSQTQHSNIRIISATNGNIQELINNTLFREDLFYRLNTIELRVPSLKERTIDIVPLAEYFIKQYSKKYNREALSLSACAKTALTQYAWPGNIRELSHIMERSVLLATSNELNANDLPILNNESINHHINSNEQSSEEKLTNALPMMSLEEAERLLIKQALKIENQNVPKAATLLGLTKSSLYRRIEKYDDIQK